MIGEFAAANRVIPVDIGGNLVRVPLVDVVHQSVDRQPESSHASARDDPEIRRLLKAVRRIVEAQYG